MRAQDLLSASVTTVAPSYSDGESSIYVPSRECHWHRSVQLQTREKNALSCSCKLFTKSTQSRGPENIGPERPLRGLLARGQVLSPTRITPENNGKIRPEPDRENAFTKASGGGYGPDIEPSHVHNTLILLHAIALQRVNRCRCA